MSGTNQFNFDSYLFSRDKNNSAYWPSSAEDQSFETLSEHIDPKSEEPETNVSMLVKKVSDKMLKIVEEQLGRP